MTVPLGALLPGLWNEIEAPVGQILSRLALLVFFEKG
jgi:hypothetical protein